jgi:TPP-dependent 2-oxoacid decarboxylase
MTEQRRPEGWEVGAFLAIGAGVGVALGVAMDNIGLWLAIGVAVGVVLGAAVTAQRRRGP